MAAGHEAELAELAAVKAELAALKAGERKPYLDKAGKPLKIGDEVLLLGIVKEIFHKQDGDKVTFACKGFVHDQVDFHVSAADLAKVEP